MTVSLPYRYIAVEGNIGAGKTSLARILANKYHGRLVLEEFADNTFLPQFYEQPERFAFPLEMSFLAERYQQLLREQQLARDEKRLLISDYLFEKSLLFAEVNLKEDEYRLFERFHRLIHHGLDAPDLLLFLHRSTPQLLRNIAQRGRDFEKQIAPAYLDKITESYLKYLQSIRNYPVLVFESDTFDFVHKPEDLRFLMNQISQPHDTGIQFITL